MGASNDGWDADVLVLGASLSGLFVAAAAASAGSSVVLLDRDVLPDVPAPRAGVPQGTQPHVLLRRGQLAAEDLLPGLRRRLTDAGAVSIDTGRIAWLGEHGWQPTSPSYELLSMTRPLLEHVVRQQVLALPGVQLRAGTAVTGLRRDERGWEVVVRGGPVLRAPLVVDATGRASRLPQWLAELGLRLPQPARVDARLGYATQVFAGGPDPRDLPAVVLQATPASLVGGAAFPIEGGGWLVSAVGFGDHRPPRDAASMGAFLAALPDPAVSDLSRCAQPRGDVAVHRQTDNRRHRYGEVRDWPDGLLVVGDALCCFDPVYGQGISVAACEAVLVREAMTAGLRPGSARCLLRSFDRVVSLPWTLATGEDLRMPTSAGRQTRAQAAVSAWAAEVSRRAVHGDLRAHAVLMSTYHLVGSPMALLHPAVLASVARARLRGPGDPSPRPASLDALVPS